MRLITRFKIVTIAIALVCSGQVYGQTNDDQKIDRAQAAQQAQKQLNGRVLRVDQKKNSYKVKVLQKSGRVVTVDVDKKSGKVSNTSKKDH